ncbi:toll/interleukin-1 receptor domain-containing protein, partial [Planctomycetota bacterium]
DDDTAISPGTPNWERAIREGIRRAFAVVLVCSPNTPGSNYIQPELHVAQHHDCVVIPIWIEGENWVNCVPLSFFSHEHIDARNERFDNAIRILTRELEEIIASRLPRLSVVESISDCPMAWTPIVLPTIRGQGFDPYEAGALWDPCYNESLLPEGNRIVAANMIKYSSFEEFLYDLYTNYLREIYEPYSYGADWVLAKASIFVTILALPWQWIRHKRTRRLIEVIPEYTELTTPIATFGLDKPRKPGRRKVWVVLEQGFEDACGLFTSNDMAAELVLQPITKLLYTIIHRHLHYIQQDPHCVDFGIYSLQTVNPDDYKHKFVVIPDCDRYKRYEQLTDCDIFVLPKDMRECLKHR